MSEVVPGSDAHDRLLWLPGIERLLGQTVHAAMVRYLENSGGSQESLAGHPLLRGLLGVTRQDVAHASCRDFEDHTRVVRLDVRRRILRRPQDADRCTSQAPRHSGVQEPLLDRSSWCQTLQ